MLVKNEYNTNLAAYVSVLVLALMVVATLTLLVMAGKTYAELPVVQVDAVSKKCVQVITPNGAGDCAHMPTKYVQEYVAPISMR